MTTMAMPPSPSSLRAAVTRTPKGGGGGRRGGRRWRRKRRMSGRPRGLACWRREDRFYCTMLSIFSELYCISQTHRHKKEERIYYFFSLGPPPVSTKGRCDLNVSEEGGKKDLFYSSLCTNAFVLLELLLFFIKSKNSALYFAPMIRNTVSQLAFLPFTLKGDTRYYVLIKGPRMCSEAFFL